MSTHEESRSPSNPSDVGKYDDGICAICLGPHINKSNPDCGHVFCFQCLVDWCKIKLECPTCKQPFKNFRHSIQNRPTCDQIYTPDPPPAPADQQQPTAEMLNISFIDDGGIFERWMIQASDRPVRLHVRRWSDPAYRLRFFANLNREFNVVGSDNVIDIIRRDRDSSN